MTSSGVRLWFGFCVVLMLVAVAIGFVAGHWMSAATNLVFAAGLFTMYVMGDEVPPTRSPRFIIGLSLILVSAAAMIGQWVGWIA